MQNADRQTLGFQLPDLPGEEFRIVIPELISDSTQSILPWGLVSPEFDIGKDKARCVVEIPGIIRSEAEIRFRDEQIDALVRATNLSTQTWDQLNAFTCFAYYRGPSFADPELTRTYWQVDGKWTSVAELFAHRDPGRGPYTFFPVGGGPRLEDLWAYREIGQAHPQTVAKGCGLCCLGRREVGRRDPHPQSRLPFCQSAPYMHSCGPAHGNSLPRGYE